MTSVLRTYSPSTKSMRGTITLKSSSRTNKPLKKLVITKKSTGGRNSKGHITMRFRGGANKIKYRIIAFKKTIFDIIESIASGEQSAQKSY